MKKLVIVESPTKAKTISKFLGHAYKVESSFGHLRDLPKSKMGIDIENNFTPQYIVPRDKTKRANELKRHATQADEIYFATDEDREGEAISWHLTQLFSMDPTKVKRITFHEITKDAILHALEHPKTISIELVNSQQARRVLDRLVGYELSPFLWKKVAKGLSAGRVQSVAVRLIVEREREILAFKQEEYWTILATFFQEGDESVSFAAKLFKIDGKSLEKLDIKTKVQADDIVARIKESPKFIIESVERKEVKKNAPPPFTTSTMQQQANNKLGFSAKQTMMLAQQLYEGIDVGDDGATGLITYMRTDSLNLSESFLQEARTYITGSLGDAYLHEKPRRFKTKSKSAQEAHEAIRPTSLFRTPEQMEKFLDDKQLKLYRLIWSRACASQMKEATLDTTTITVKSGDEKYIFKATGSVIKFDGFLKVYPIEMKENILPNISEQENVILSLVSDEQHFTQPPARYTEASLIKSLEEYGIGRPSTYAPTIATIVERNYVVKEDKQLKPTEIALLVNDLLVEHFPEIVDYEFTANMETKFDDIAQGQVEWQPVIGEFYTRFKENLTKKYDEISKKELTEETTSEKCEKCESAMVIKMGRFGKFLACSNYPQCKNTKNIENGQIEAETQTLDEECPQCGAKLTYKRGRFGKFIGCSNYPDCKYIKPNHIATNVGCPACKLGKIVGKKSKRGKLFYSCERYPECTFALWDKPTGETCPSCSALLVERKKAISCSNAECVYKKDKEKK